MKKLLLGLLVLPALTLAVSDASASWSICGQSSCSYSFRSPRFWMGFDCGNPPCCQGGAGYGYGAPATGVPAAPVAPAAAAPIPWFNQFPPQHPHAQAPIAAPAPIQAPAPAPTTLPASYQTSIGSYAPNSGSYQIPAYWYGR